MPGGDTGGPDPGWRRRVILAVVVCSILAAVGLSRLQIDDDLRSLLRNGSDDFVVVDEIAERFGAPDRDCIVRVSATTDSLFTPATLEHLRDLVDDLASIEGVEEVRSMFDIRRQGAAGALLPVIPRVAGPLDEAACAAARERCQRHPLIAGHLLSAEADSALLLVRLGPGRETPAGADPVIEAIARELAGREGLDGELTGLPALRTEAARALRRDMIVFNALGMSLAVILSASVARSLPSTLVACVPPFVGAVWAIGVLGLCGAKINILTSVVPSLALVVGTCDSIHFIEDMRRSVRRGIDPFVASSGAIRRVGAACGLTSVVTAIGFASLAAARIEAVRTFGIAAAAGAMASFTAVTLLTPLLASLPICRGMRLGRSSRGASRLAAFLAGWSVRHARILAPAGIVATLALGLLSSGLDADNRVVDALPRGAASSRALMHVDEEFGGAFGADVLVSWPEGLDWREAEVLDGIAAVHGVLEGVDPEIRAVSISTVAGTIGERARRRLDPAPFGDLLDATARKAVVRARIRDVGSRTLERFYDRIDAGLTGLASSHPGWEFQLAGMSVLSARNVRQLVRDLGSSLALEVAVIGLILALAFRSPLAGLVSLVPNIFPLAVIGAVMVATGRHLDPATVIVFNVCLGLAVDDTVHLLSALERQRRPGLSIESAIRRGVAETGNAIIVGGVVLTIGFGAVTVSRVPSLASFGILACAAVAAATVAELVMLPALLVVTDRLVRRFPPPWRDNVFGSPDPARDEAQPFPRVARGTISESASTVRTI